MARIRNGILGGFRNKVGSVIGQVYGGASVMRAMPSQVANPQTTAQVDHRALFGQMCRIMSVANGLLRLSTWQENPVKNGFNGAMRHNWRNAILPVTPGSEKLYIEPKLLEFGTFNTPPLLNLDVQVVDDDPTMKAVLQWTANTPGYDDVDDDPVVVVCVHTREHLDPEVWYCGTGSLTRSAGGGTVNLFEYTTEILPGSPEDDVAVYVGVVSKKGRNPQKPNQTIEIPAKNVVRFSAGASLKKAVNKNS